MFKYPKGYYKKGNEKYNNLNKNKNYKEDFEYDFRYQISKKQGCHKYISNLDKNDILLFKEYDRYYTHGKGSKIFINEQDNLIMFEGYLYD